MMKDQSIGAGDLVIFIRGYICPKCGNNHEHVLGKIRKVVGIAYEPDARCGSCHRVVHVGERMAQFDEPDGVKIFPVRCLKKIYPKGLTKEVLDDSRLEA